MSGSRRSVGPVKQLSLQQPPSRRQQVRRQRSVEDEKSLQIYNNAISRGKIGGNGRSDSERPKIRLAWSENRRKNEKQIEQVEVVARQISGRTRPTTGKSRAFIGGEKASILYSRQELAERLRLAWKHREENKANIDIFLAHGTVEERCDSELSSYATVTAPSTPQPKRHILKVENFLVAECKNTESDENEKTTDDTNLNENDTIVMSEDFVKKTAAVSLKNHSAGHSDKNEKRELSLDTEQSYIYVEKVLEADGNEVTGNIERQEKKHSEGEEEEMADVSKDPTAECSSDIKKKAFINIDCSNVHVQPTTLPSIKGINSGPLKPTKEDFSSAKQKRASFHSGTNKAFLGRIKSPTEVRYNSHTKSNPTIEIIASVRTTVENKSNLISDKIQSAKNVEEVTCNATSDKTLFHKATDIKSNLTIDKNTRTKTIIETRDLTEEKISIGMPIDIKCNSTQLENATDVTSGSTIEKHISGAMENKDLIMNDKAAVGKCNGVTEKNGSLKKVQESQRIEQKSRRTNSAPPQRHVASSGSRVQVNIVIDTPGVLGAGKASIGNSQEKSDRKDDVPERMDSASPKLLCGRSIRSAPLKRRAKSSKKRYWDSCRNDEDGKTARNRSGSRGKSSIDCKAIDVVTMVSLVSSADSDSDIENSPGDDKLINELRSKLPTTSIIKTSINSALNVARKPIKSVSFQRDSSDEDTPKEQVPTKEEKRAQPRFTIVNNRGNGGNSSSSDETVPWKTDVPSLALPGLALLHDAEETLDVPLTDREKRCLAVPIGDLHDKKRKLLRTRSTPSRSGIEKQMSMDIKGHQPSGILARNESSNQQNKTLVENSPPKVETSVTTLKEADQEARLVPSEPHFQTSKEKECWHLYKKMCDKGVCVSFDTVLRGMLTPTEYRLRQKELMQDL